MDTDIRDEIERSFGDGPPVEDSPDLLGLGQRALRRRRLTTTAGAAVLVVALAGTAWSATGSPGTSTGPDVATDAPSTSATPEPTPVAGDVTFVPDDDPRLGNGLAAYADGTLLVQEGAEVLEYLDNPLDVHTPRLSAGLALRADGQETWLLVTANQHSGAVMSAPAHQSMPTLQAWIRELQNTEGSQTLVNFGTGSQLVAEPGVEILRQQPDPDVGGSFADDAQRTAVAEVRWQGERWFVLAREVVGSDPEYIPTAASVVPDPTLAGFLEYARSAYDSEAGVR
jgi:hypothetical protein